MKRLVALAAAAVLAGCSNDPRLERLAEHAATTTGTIRLVECDSARRVFKVYYRFEVEGVPQAGRAEPGSIGCRGLQVGSPVQVWYLPEDPRIHTLLPPGEKLARARRSWYGPAYLGVGLLVLAASVVVHARSGRKR